MSNRIKISIEKAKTTFKNATQEEINFFNKPKSLVALTAASITTIAIYSEDISKTIGISRSDKESIKRAIKSNNFSKSILNFVNSNTPVVCTIDGNIETNLDSSDFDEKTSSSIYDVINTASEILPYFLLLRYILDEIENLLSKTEFPSEYRMSYIQKLIRALAAIIKRDISSAKPQLVRSIDDVKNPKDKILKILKDIDKIIIVIVSASLVYINNRLLLQQKSNEFLKEEISLHCVDSNIESFDINVSPVSFNESISCPVNADEFIIPHLPIEEKESEFSCEIEEIEQTNNDTQYYNLSTKAIIENKTEEKLIVFSAIDSKIEPNMLIGIVGSKNVYSPLFGYIEKIEANKIYIKDIEDATGSNADILREKYEELNSTKEFLKAYNVNSLYPSMLVTATTSLNINVGISVKNKHEELLKDYDKKTKKYLKNIKSITGEHNVKKHVENETTHLIKEEIDKEEKLLFDWIYASLKYSQNIAKLTSPLPNEFFLTNYYKDLVHTLNLIKEPNSIEKSFRDKINEFINKKTTITEEASYLTTFFDNLWKRYKELPKEIEIATQKINEQQQFVSYSIQEIEGEQYRIYTISNQISCPKQEDMRTKYGFGDMEYWVKYCTYATLASVSNPVTGWSTGILFPAPIKLPVVYIPIKSFYTDYGFVLLGLTICGIMVFPFTLFANYTEKHTVPVGDPTSFLKKEAESLKKQISKQMNMFKKDTLKIELEKIRKDIEAKDIEIIVAKESIQMHLLNKPADIQKNIKNLALWTEKNLMLKEVLLTKKLEKFKLATKYKLIKDAISLGSSIRTKTDSNITKQEELLNTQFEKLNKVLDNIDKTISALPIAMKPQTVNFGITLKNPKPIINIDENIDENINYKVLDSIINKTKIDNEKLEFKKYKDLLKTSSLIKNDPFPRYENLKITNIQWISFLTKKWAPIGAVSFGIPGQLPIAI